MKTLFALLLSIPQALVSGFVFSNMWNWFIIRKFPSAPHLTFLDAVGMLTTLGFPLLCVHMINSKKELMEKHPDMSDIEASITLSLVLTLFIYPVMLCFAYLWHLVIGN